MGRWRDGPGRRILDLLLPPRCLQCGTPVAEPGTLCGACWHELTFLAPPWCPCCGRPFAVPAPAETLCGACLQRPPRHGRSRAALRYDHASRPLVLALKHGDRTDMAPALGRWMAAAGADLLGDADLLVPVPLHGLRLWRRRYNQAALLAQAVGRTAGVAVAVRGLTRARNTRSQGGLGRAARHRNVRGVFQLGHPVQGARVVVIDDVMTTGATLDACARVLRAGGAARVDVLTLARVLPLTG